MKRIAIVGLANLFPGSKEPGKFWNNLLAKVDSRTLATPYQMGDAPERFYQAGKGHDDKYYCQTGGYIHDFSMSADGFDLSEETLSGLDDVFKWSLYVAREALKDSGYHGRQDILARCGVLLGNLSFPTKKSNELFLPLYHKPLETALKSLLGDDDFCLDSYLANGDGGAKQAVDPKNGLIAGYPAAVIAKSLNLGAMHYALDAACASSLYSVKLACDHLNMGKADMMLAGAVSGGDPFFVNMGFSIFQAYPENGIHAPLDTNSQGLFAGEGAGMLVLKRYDDAVRDGDKIYASILAGGLSNDGKGQHVLSPNSKGQVLAYKRAYDDANVDPSTVDFVECHATGTPLGDKVEITSMETFFGSDESGNERSVPMIGSVKSNLGHLLTAAGMPGMSKVILGMQSGKIPPTINVNNPQVSKNGLIGADQIPVETINWPITDGQPKRAASSVFGFGGCNAHMVFEEHVPGAVVTADSDAASDAALNKSYQPQSMAIVGMDSLFGNCIGLSNFEQSIYSGKQHFIPLPKQRWKGIDNVERDLPFNPPATGAYIDNFDVDFMRFKVPPKEEDSLIPQQLLTMKVVDGALHDAGMEPGGNVAVLVAMGTELELHQFRGRVNLTTQIVDSLKANGISLSSDDEAELENIAKDSIYDVAKLNKYTSFIGNIMAARISSLWDFNGPAFTVSSEENSVFKCLDLAQNLLGTSDVDAVVVAAVDLSGSLENVMLRQRMNPLNTADHSMGFNESVNGWSVGEGAGAVVLKRSVDAQSDKQKVYCQIDGIGFSAGSDANAVANASNMALNQAGRVAADIGYIEAFASGNAEEDQQEIRGLNAVFHSPDDNSNTKNTAIGSVKANIGHTYSASGMASLIKTALCLKNRFIPGVPNWQAPSDRPTWDNSRFYVQNESKNWLTENIRCASISGLGADDTAAHVVLSEYSQTSAADSKLNAEDSSTLVLIQGDSQDQLLEALTQCEARIDVLPLRHLAAEQFAASNGKKAKYTVALLASTQKQLAQELAAAKAGVVKAIQSGKSWNTPNGSMFTPSSLGAGAKISFVYPGGFASYVGLGKDISRLFPETMETMKVHTNRLGDMIGDRLFHPRTVEALDKEQVKALSRELIHTPIAMFESGICYSKLLTEILSKQFGVKPSSAIGYSMGEISMMYAMDVWGSADKMSELLHGLPVFRTRLAGPMDTVREAWAIDASVPDEDIWTGYTVKAPIKQVQEIVDTEDKVFLILINTSNECVIAGDPSACARVVKQLGCENFIAPMSDVIHCPLVRADINELATLHRMPIANQTSATLFSAVGYQGVEVSSDNIANNIAEMYCNPVDFPRLVNAAYDDGARIFIELGPRDSCTQYVSAALGDKEHLAVALDNKGRDEKSAMVRALAKLATHQIDIDLSPLFDMTLLEPVSKKGLIKQVALGRKSLHDSVLSEKNLTRFEPVRRTVKPQVLASVSPTLAPSVPILNTPLPKPITAQPQIRVEPVAGERALKPAAIISASSAFNNNDKTADKIMSESKSQLAAYRANLSKVNESHQAFLQSRQDALGEVTELIELQIQLATSGQRVGSSTIGGSNATNYSSAVSVEPVTPMAYAQVASKTTPDASYAVAVPLVLEERYSVPDNIIWDTADLVEFAEGKIGNVFGPEFDVIDNYVRRVRLPTTDYLLVTRVTKLDAVVGEYKPCSMTTEYDIPTDAPYLVAGQIPWAVSVESGQCDLLLISYLGIDFTNKGERVYRLLDCTLTFMDDMAFGGETLRYDISINSYANNGDALLFFFSYECFVGDKLVLKMDGGCAGFFTDEELADGKGVIKNEDDRKEIANAVKQDFPPLLTTPKTTYEHEDMRKLIDGDTGACFGPAYDKQGTNPALCFASEKFLMIERITSIQSKAGAWGLGIVEGQKQLDPNHWYFPCHFKDDQVMAGSLMAEGCGQLLMFYMMYLGMHTQVSNARFQPMPGEAQQVRCRGQVLPQHATLEYRMEVTEIGLSPYPYAKANVDIILNGKVVVDFKNISVMLKEQGGEDLAVEPILTAPPMRVESDLSREKITGVTPILHFEAPHLNPPVGGIADNRVPDTVPYQPYHMFEFATGDISKCFGSDFDFYKDITPPRTPCGDLQLTTRVTEVRGKRGELKKPSYCKGEYEVPADAWYYTGNAHPGVMPYSVLMEISLQPNGFVSAWAGTTLRFPDKELFFRNLDGSGTLLREVDLRGKTIINDSNLLSTTIVGNNIVQSFDFTLSTDNEPFYKGTAVFGYFEASALKDQLGLDKGEITEPWHRVNNIAETNVTTIDLTSDEIQQSMYQAPAAKPHYKLAGGQLNFIDRVEIVADGGKEGKGYIFAERTIDVTDWFFPFHFHGDPVMPGSLGVEAIIQSMQVYALENKLGAEFSNPMFSTILSTVKWKYRGQINPTNKKMSLDVHIKEIQHNNGEVVVIGDASLSKDGLRIYEVYDIAIAIKEA